MAMDITEFAALSEAAKAEFELDTAALAERIEKARRSIERDEARLRKAQDDLVAKLSALARRFAGIEEEAPTERHVETPARSRRGKTVRSDRPKRLEFDAPLLELALTLPQPFSVAQVTEAWKAIHPEVELSRSTVRGALDRHLGRFLELFTEGGRGNANPRTYIPKEQPWLSNVLRA